jgi:hypothetical protein
LLKRQPKKRLWLIVALVLITGGWMAFDGAHALVTGDFVTPQSGPYAGQLGPWTVIPSAFGIEPRSTAVKAFFVVFGLVYLAALGAFLLGRTGARGVLTACAGVGLLYLPVGTLTSAAVLALLATLPREDRSV